MSPLPWDHNDLDPDFKEYFKDKNDLSIIDLGCGNGSQAYHLEEIGFDVTATDIDNYLVYDIGNFIIDDALNTISSSLVENIPFCFITNNERDLERVIKLQNEFDILNEFQTNVRGIKIRGSFQTQEEAQLRCRMLREIDPNHDIYVGQVGMWMPFDPDAYRTGNIEYMEDELNHLMHEIALAVCLIIKINL